MLNKYFFINSVHSLKTSSLTGEYILWGLLILFIPIYPAIFIFYLLVILSQDQRYTYFVFFIILSILIILNINRSVDNDLENYLSIFKFMNTSTLRGFFEDSNQFIVSLKLSEAVWYGITWLISNLTNANEFIYIAFLTFVIYGIYFWGLKEIVEFMNENSQFYIMAISFGMLICINFSETTHLIRQYICGSVLFLQFVWLFKKQYLKVFLAFIPSLLIHNSLIVPFFIIIISYVLFFQKIINNKILRLFLIPIITGSVIGYAINIFVNQFNYETSVSSGGLFFSMSLDVATYMLTLGFFLYSKNSRNINMLVEGYLIFFLMFVAFLFFLRSNMTLYLRFYLYLEWFRVLGLISLTALFPIFKRSSILFVLFFMFCFLFLQLRILRAPWTYEIGFIKLMSLNIFQILKPIFNNITF